MTLQRIAYDACRLRNGAGYRVVAAFSCVKHPLFKPPLPDVMTWRKCTSCGHVFTEGYFGADALNVLL